MHCFCLFLARCPQTLPAYPPISKGFFPSKYRLLNEKISAIICKFWDCPVEAVVTMDLPGFPQRLENLENENGHEWAWTMKNCPKVMEFCYQSWDFTNFAPALYQLCKCTIDKRDSHGKLRNGHGKVMKTILSSLWEPCLPCSSSVTRTDWYQPSSLGSTSEFAQQCRLIQNGG